MGAFLAPKLSFYCLPTDANKQPTISAKESHKIELDSGVHFGRKIWLHISLSPHHNSGIIFLTKRALINGICLVVVDFTSINTLLITVSFCDFSRA